MSAQASQLRGSSTRSGTLADSLAAVFATYYWELRKQSSSSDPRLKRLVVGFVVDGRCGIRRVASFPRNRRV